MAATYAELGGDFAIEELPRRVHSSQLHYLRARQFTGC